MRAFLIEFKDAITARSGVYLIQRTDTMETLRHLGLTKRNLEEILLSLSIVNYSSGPEADRDRGGNIWVFGKMIKGEEIYIKIKVGDIKGTKIAKCISFHISVHPLRYSFAGDDAGM